jgi:DUF1680 family protein
MPVIEPPIETRSRSLRQIPFNEVTLTDDFWQPRLLTQKRTTLPFALEKTERAVINLRRCGNYLKGVPDELPMPHRFVTSDLYKVMEGAAYLLMVEPDPELEARMDELIALIGEAQQDDGYLYISHICKHISSVAEMGETPYSHLVHSHEVYNVGHMYEGAVAYFRATGKRAWLDIAEKSARHLNSALFEGDPNYNNGAPVNQAPGHQETELALCKLYQVTGNELYLDMARKMLDIRGITYQPSGEGVMHPEYAQQHRPVAEQERAVGHAVRAGYMYAGMADVDALSGTDTYREALENVWRDIVDTKMHITGGLGAIHGIEGFGPAYDLPNKDAYNETCAAIANVLFNYRLTLMTRDAKYFDVAEVALFNNSLAGVSLSGDRFFYVNPLEADGTELFNHGAAGRSPWFDCACCPSNVARIMPQVAGYMYASDDTEIMALLYGGSEVEVALADGPVQLKQTTGYPFDGDVKIDVNLRSPQTFALTLRIPTWTGDQFVPGELYRYETSNAERRTSNVEVRVNSQVVNGEAKNGFVSIDREWLDGDVVELHLPMDVRFSRCDERVVDNRDRFAVTRGPLVYCAEEADNGGAVQRLWSDGVPAAENCGVRKFADGELAGMTAIDMPMRDLDANEVAATLVPYFAWNNRGNASMNVWFPTSRESAAKATAEAAFDDSKYGIISVSSCGDEAHATALHDGRRPQSAYDRSIDHWRSDETFADEHVVTLTFDGSQAVESLGVYWFVDGDTDLPASWRMDYLAHGEWHPFELYVTDFFGTDMNRYVVVHPAADLSCEALRLVITPQVGKDVGLLDLDLKIRRRI